MSFYKRELNAANLTVFETMTHDDLVNIIQELNKERKDALAQVNRLLKQKRDLMSRFGYYTWDQFVESLG